MDCIFCKIIDGSIESKKVYEDESVLAFYDVNPQAPIHILVIPKTHIESISCIDDSNKNIVANIATAIAKIAKQLDLKDGYRVVTNVGELGCQTVKHLHFHILGGKQLTESIC
ncbi:MAG: histidine triad nucleotide-binding protein [Oscillospiraceae bacterium]